MSHHTVHAAALHADRVSYQTNGHELLRDVSLHADPGEVVGVVGPNGSGKSTLLRTIYRQLHPSSGNIVLDHTNLADLSRRTLARRMAVVPQEHPAEFELSVEDITAMGRSPHQRTLRNDHKGDARIVMTSLEMVGMGDHAGTPFAQLSGGEKQRVLIARALAQEPALLVLDEPTNHLDMRYQLGVLNLTRQLGFTVLTALHDLNLAARFCDRLYLLHAGELAHSGTPDDVLTTELLSRTYDVAVDVVVHPRTGTPIVLPETDIAGSAA